MSQVDAGLNTNVKVDEAEAKRIMNDRQLVKVIAALEKVPQETKELIFKMAKKLSEFEIIELFNQQAQDLFNILNTLVKKYTTSKNEKEYNMTGYKFLFETALKANIRWPVDKFTLIILEFASEIYAENEDVFLNMSIPNTKVSIGNEFGLIRSEAFKKLWIILNKHDKDILKENVILLTTYAHSYLYKTVMSKSN